MFILGHLRSSRVLEASQRMHKELEEKSSEDRLKELGMFSLISKEKATSHNWHKRPLKQTESHISFLCQ